MDVAEPQAGFNTLARKGLLLCLIGPSGCGKSTIATALCAADPELRESLSTTTRAPRAGEIHGQHYNFVTTEQFNALAQGGDFLQHVTYAGTSYGTLRAPVENAMTAGKDTLFVVTAEGADNLRRASPGNVVSVFIMPPSAQELESRLRGRGTDSEEVIRKRMASAQAEMADHNRADYLVVNDKVERVVCEIRTILAAERLKQLRQTGATQQAQFIRKALVNG
jgi:guanylate kinase